MGRNQSWMQSLASNFKKAIENTLTLTTAEDNVLYFAFLKSLQYTGEWLKVKCWSINLD